MKIVLYFSTVFGIFWLIRGALSHNDLVAERNTVQHSNASEDRESEYLFSESTNLQDKVLIKSESPLRGRKIHQTAWSKENDREQSQEVSKPSEKKTPELDNSWTLEKLLKYLMSFVYETEESDQPSHIWITSDDLKDKLKQKVNTKNKQTTNTKTEKNEDGISKDIQNSRREHSLMFKKGYLKDYQTFNRKQVESEIRYESKESYENSYEYEDSRFDEEQVDENQIHHKTSTEKLQNIRTKHTFQDDKEYEKNHTFTKPDQSSSIRDDEITDSEDCFEYIDINQEQNSQENENMTLKKNISKSNDMEQSSEELIYKNKQETVLKEKHSVNKGNKTILENITEKEDGLHTSKESHEIIVLNGTQHTGQNTKNVKKDKPETSITRKSKTELSNSEIEVNEKISKEIFISDHQEIQLDSHMHKEWAQSKSNSSQTAIKDEIANSVLEPSAQNNSDDIDENLNSSPTKSKPLKKQQGSKSSLSETKQTTSKNNEKLKNEDVQTIYDQQNNSDDIDENLKNSSPTKSKPLKKQQESKSSLSETKQTTSKNNEKPKNEDVQTTYEGQNEEALVITSSIDTTTKSRDLDEDNVTVIKIHPEILVIDDTRQEKVHAIYNEETFNNPVDLVIISSIDSTIKSRDLDEDNATVLEINPEILVIDDTRQEKIQTYNKETIINPVDFVITSSIDSTTKSRDLNEDHPEILAINDARQEKIQTIYNEETINNPVDFVITSSIDSTTKSRDLNEDHSEILAINDARQEKIQTIYNEEIIINPVAIKPIQENGIEIQNGENKELDVQNKIPNFKILEKHLVEENQKEKTENYEGLLQHQTKQSNSRISAAENNLQNYIHLNKNLDDQVNENPLIFKFKEDNAYEYILEGNEFIQVNDNEEQHKGLNYTFNKYDYESENKSQLLTDSIMTMLENVQHTDDEQQETFNTILEFLYKHSNNPLILSLKENLSNSTI